MRRVDDLDEQTGTYAVFTLTHMVTVLIKIPRGKYNAITHFIAPRSSAVDVGGSNVSPGPR